MLFGHNAQLDNFPNSLSIFCTESYILPHMKDQTSRQLKESLTSLFTLKPFDYSRDLGMQSLRNKHSWNETVKMWIQKEHRQNKTLTVFPARFIISTLSMIKASIFVYMYMSGKVSFEQYIYDLISTPISMVCEWMSCRGCHSQSEIFFSRLGDYFTWLNSSKSKKMHGSFLVNLVNAS